MNIEIKIDKLIFGGHGMGLIDGKVCFVEGALPGEKILAKIFQDKKNFLRARLIKILEPSPDRIEAPCPYVQSCGGCQYQHLTYKEELRWKQNEIRENFKKWLRQDNIPMDEIQHDENFYGYRTSITLHRTSPQNACPQRLGFFGRDNRSVITIDNCLLAHERLKTIFRQEHLLKKQEKSRTFKLAANREIVTSENPAPYQVKVGCESLTASSAGFFQNNLEVCALMTQKIKAWIEEVQPNRLFDLYAGVGTFSLLSGSRTPEIYCFEGNPASMECLRQNFADKKISLACAIPGRVEKTFPDFLKQNPKEKTLIFLDPPRQGIQTSLAHCLADEQGVQNIFYVACDPMILIRDLKIILAKKKFAINRVATFDMFPRTQHIETAVWLTQSSLHER